MNVEEKAKILALFNKYYDIFYFEDQPLTFINEIKHQIPTVHEKSV